jgi:putative spermidine/putrescine transport system substrate-binding protein
VSLISKANRWTRLLPLVAGLVVAISACGGSSPSSTNTASAAPSAAPENQLVMAGGAGASGDAFQKILGAWGAANNVKVTYITGTSASTFAKIQAQSQAGQPQIDIFNANDQITALGRAQQLWAPVNMNYLTNKKDLDSSLAFPTDVVGNPPQAARLFVIPSGIAYNADVFQKNGWPAPTSWLDLVNPTYGKCLVPLDPNQGVPWIPMLNTVTTGDWTNSTKTFQMLKAVAGSIQSWTNTNPSALALVAKGTGCMTPTSQGRFVEASVNAPSLKYVTPKEGMVVFGGTLNVIKNAPHPIAAQLALNLLLGADAGNQLLAASYFPSVNTKVVAPTSGPAAQVPTAAEVKKLNPKQVPIETYDHTTDWLHQYQAIASGS